MLNSIEEVIEDIRNGKMVIVVDNEDRENEGDIVAAAEMVTPDVINFMAGYGRGLICVSIPSYRARELMLSPMVQKNSDSHETAFTISVDARETSTGISAYERAKTIKKLVSPDAVPEDFNRPGHVFPLIARDGGVLERPGHTEASSDLARLAGLYPAGVICEIMNDDGTMARLPQLIEFAKNHNLKITSVEKLIEYRLKADNGVQMSVKTHLPTAYGDFTLVAYPDSNSSEPHIVLLMGDVSGDKARPVLTRIHSECMTGDVFGSLRCDCGSQLHRALRMIAREGRGILIYMRQEGRGIGLMNKLKAYRLQDEGYDTVDANLQLGFPPDLRDYRTAAAILKDLGINSIRLLTNNPDKISDIEKYGIHVAERVPLITGRNSINSRYLNTKREKMGHMI
ncbi:MAG: bifunctional 3,4-dihydroxy-2-butanone-4-phosphate synthase/GTP cyclohydrolase II [Thermoanaerobacteraceae bacterium]|nr:bifunctional 3,4-dihydroxy-2-butanone-4-phosphate synthase/GTP cyclohydrolase II [Thermoanaerobacteraceae bacterium]